ncbi:MAG: response regulator transcription factor [Leptothrix ochracea]|uniref:response regulator transcription factor n=1 Tax=Leptothrix ochracea TaxID=735331 RepID=UPI0034E21083
MNAAIHIVDDEAAVREALIFLFDAHGLAAQGYASGVDFLAALAAQPLRGCVLLDVRMEPMSGLQVHDEMVRRGAQLPVLFLSGHGDIAMAVDALRKGAYDFIEKPFLDDSLVERVQHALAIDAARSQDNAKAAELQARLNSLSEREHEVLRRVAAGKLNKQIADELCIAVRTVEVHRARGLAKLGVRSAAEAAVLLQLRV